MVVEEVRVPMMQSSDGPTRAKCAATTFLIVLVVCSVLVILSPASVSESVRRHHDMWTTRPAPGVNVARVPTWLLPEYGMEYPTVAANTAALSAEQTEAMVLRALSLGITNIDVHLGGSEREGLSAALRRVDREEVFIVTKIDRPPANTTDPAAAAQLVRDTVAREWPLLGVDAVDVLLLKDSASCPVMQSQWAALEGLLAEGKARALGTYNYCQSALKCLLATAETPPAFNYIMRHVGMGPDSTSLIQYGEARGIRTVTYGTLGEPVALPELLTHPVLMDIAARHGRSVEEVALRWNLQAGFAVSNRPSADYAPANAPFGMVCPGPGGDCDAGLQGMQEAFTWELTRADMARLDEVRIDQWSQSPTYYGSAGCESSFEAVEHPIASSCRVVGAKWCGSLPFLKDTAMGGTLASRTEDNGGTSI